MDQPSTSKADEKPLQIQVVFFCPICPDVLLCSKGSTNTAVSANKHFKEHHPSIPKDKCRACLNVHRSVEERILCLRSRSIERRTVNRVIALRTTTPNLRYKRKHDTIPCARDERLRKGPQLDDQFRRHRPSEDLIVNFRMPTPHTFRPSLANVTSAPLHLAIVPLPAYETTDRYVEYFERLYERADPNTARGKAVRLLTCFESDAFFHLFVFWKQTETFKRLCEEHPNLVQFTEFFCFCDYTTSSEKDVETRLHLHALVRIPDEKEFKKQIFNGLKPDRKGIRCKSSARIKNFDHFFNTMLYVSQPKKCRVSKYRSRPEKSDSLEDDESLLLEENEFAEEDGDESKKSDGESKPDGGESKKGDYDDHFAMNVPLSDKDQLYLTLAFPTIALNFVSRFDKLPHLQHYDIHRFTDKDYRSKLADVLGQIGYFQHTAPNDVMLDAENDRVVVVESQGLTAKDFLLKFCETSDGERYVRWKGTAKTFCEMKFETKLATRLPRETVTLLVKSSEDEVILRNEATGKGATVEEPKWLRGMLREELKTNNVHLKGIVKDVQKVRRWLEGSNQRGENRFTFMVDRTVFDITYTYEDGLASDSEREDEEMLDAP